jgi:polyvinyl alcohol dehydrogenase (cytochrome)
VIRFKRATAAVVATAAMIAAGCTDGTPRGGASWVMWGHDYSNTHSQPAERTLTAANVSRLKPKWVTELKGDVSASPTVADGVAYIPDWGGYLSAVDTKTGAIKWQKKVTDYVGIENYFTRNAPTVDGDQLIIGFNVHHTHAGLLGSGDTDPPDDHGDHEHGEEEMPIPQGAWVGAVSRADGSLRWVKQVEKRVYAAITGNPVVHNGRAIVGVSSNEWDFTGDKAFKCCESRGSVVALNTRNGNVIWQTYTIPETKACETPPVGDTPASNCGFSGGSVASTPALDTGRNTLFVGTGQNYTVPDTVRDCIVNARAANQLDTTCAVADDHIDSLLALDFTTGRIKWAKQVLPFDAWNAACVTSPGVGNCPDPFGDDADLISSPNLFSVRTGLRSQDVVGSGQKAGIYWAFDRDTGRELWHTKVGPGSVLGGIEWGTAVDDNRIYAPIANPFSLPYAAPDGTAIRGGSWAGLDRGTGRILWQTQVPTGTGNNAALASPVVANGVMFGASIEKSGNNFFALDGATGKVLWSFASGGSSIASPAVVDGVLYWGTGYSHLSVAGAGPSNKFYAFSVDGK